MQSISDVSDQSQKNSAISDFIIDEFKDFYTKGLSAGFSSFSSSFEYSKQFESEATDKIKKLFSISVNNSYSAAQNLFNEQALVAQSLIFAFEPCNRAPQSVRDGSLNRIAKAAENAVKKVTDTDAEINKIKQNSPQKGVLDIFNLVYWPYILMLALALYFGRINARLNQNQE